MKVLPETPTEMVFLDAQEHDLTIQARAWAMIEGVFDNSTDRLALLHAAAILKATLALDEGDPLEAVKALLSEHSESTIDLLRRALALRSGQH